MCPHFPRSFLSDGAFLKCGNIFGRNPTTQPSNAPTMKPTEPTASPTPLPTILLAADFCTSIQVDIIDFDAFNSGELDENVNLQNDITNITHFAIAQMAHSVDGSLFHVLYEDSSADSEYVDSELQRSLFINESLCTKYADDLQALMLIIENEHSTISAIILDKLAALYMNGQASDSMAVSIYIATQFCAPFLCFHNLDIFGLLVLTLLIMTDHQHQRILQRSIIQR